MTKLPVALWHCVLHLRLVGGVVEQLGDVLAGADAQRGALGQPEDALMLSAQADERAHWRIGATLGQCTSRQSKDE